MPVCREILPDFRTMASIADDSIVGITIVRIVAEHGRDSAGPIGEYVRTMRAP